MLVLRFLFPLALFLSALLLFSIQPMVAKSLLPVYGGTPAVWTVCMLFFQLLMLLAYGYAWLLSFAKKPIIWLGIHALLVLISVAFLPIIFHPIAGDAPPEWSILYTLLIQLGLPLLVIAASAPLLQFAYSQTKEQGAADPYFLYIASNLGSLLALLIYPWLIERFIGLNYQFQLWNKVYVLYVLCLAFLLITTRYQPLERIKGAERSVTWRAISTWIFLSFVPCSLMLGVTLYISTDIAATPLFWVLPLALYLLSFVLTFSSKPLLSQTWLARNIFLFVVFILIGFILGTNQIIAWQMIIANLLGFFALTLLCHGQLFQRRPKPQQLTLFYFCLAIGGVLAGLFNGLIAPHLFNQVYEYPLAILLSMLVIPVSKMQKAWRIPLIILCLIGLYGVIPKTLWGFSALHSVALVILTILIVWQGSKATLFISLLLLLIFIYSPSFYDSNILLQKRNFYGVKQVVNKEGVHALISQSTMHGLQWMAEKPLGGDKSYYGAIKPVIASLQHGRNSLTAVMIGLGAGTVACQFRNNDYLQIFEIDQQMIELAMNPQLFSYLRDCPPQTKVIKNDGRLALAGIKNSSQDLLILDAFNSDAIPAHLLTLEAFTLYKQKINDNGVILVNLSNRHLQLLPVVNAMGRTLDLMVFYISHKGNSGLGQFDSEWAMLTTNQPLAFKIMDGTGWHFVADNSQRLWTDDYSNIIPLLRFR